MGRKLSTRVWDQCRRGFWHAEDLNSSDYSDDAVTREERKHMGWMNSTSFNCPAEQANLISSLCQTGKHAPVLDIDFPATLVPSSTEGHFHLYLDKEITWDKYVVLLKALQEAGICEEGFVRQSIRRGMSFLRRPEVKKEN